MANDSIVHFCIAQAERASDSTGFIAARLLASALRAEIIPRPLLVEAMLASLPTHSAPSEGQRERWVVLVDQERFGVSCEDIENERPDACLDVRLRNTIAHELAHSLSFRQDELGFRLLSRKGKNEGHAQFLSRIERETEALSPMLLIPYSRLLRLARASSGSLIDRLCGLRMEAAVSREVLIGRLRLLPKFDEQRISVDSCFENVAIGIGEWKTSSSAEFFNWPMFVNFNKGRIPELVSKLLKHQFLPASEFVSDPDFYAVGGDLQTAETAESTGKQLLSYLRMSLRVSVEMVPRKAGSRFLFVIERF